MSDLRKSDRRSTGRSDRPALDEELSDAQRAEVDNVIALADKEWPSAIKHWSTFALLRAPQSTSLPSIACIDLKTRAIQFDAVEIVKRNLSTSVGAILAHEVGHHVRYPGDLSTWLRLLLLERDVIGPHTPSVLNLFSDLAINTELGQKSKTLRRQLAAVYIAYRDDVEWTAWPAFAFALVVYTKIWDLEPDALLKNASSFHAHYPTLTRDVDQLAATLFPPSTTTFQGSQFDRFLFFLGVLKPYLEVAHPRSFTPPPGLSCVSPDAHDDDWARALDLGGEEEKALERARENGWIEDCRPKDDGDDNDDDDDADADDRVLKRARDIARGRGEEGAEAVRGILAAWYAQRARSLVVRLPTSPARNHDLLATATSDWEPGDEVGRIDWGASFRARGIELGALSPLTRDEILDDGERSETSPAPHLELFVDVSASMPDPISRRNPMTLGALVLGTSAIRAGGAARVCLYSSDHIAMPDFVRSEKALSEFLLRYLGQGTCFPSSVLAEWVQNQTQPTVRVVLTDDDLLYELEEGDDTAVNSLSIASKNSHSLLILLLGANDDTVNFVQEKTAAKVLAVPSMADFSDICAAVSRALYFPRTR